MNISSNRAASGFLAIAYVVAAFLRRGGETAFMMALFTVFPLACIWFSEAMGGYIGPATIPITKRSPGQVICVLGWLLLLLPLFIVVFYALKS